MEETKPEVLYCNVLSVVISPFDFVFDFGYKTPEQAKAKSVEYEIVARIAMSPQHAKSMLPILKRMIKEYEDKIGHIPIAQHKE
jgi:hypothetical protein